MIVINHKRLIEYFDYITYYLAFYALTLIFHVLLQPMTETIAVLQLLCGVFIFAVDMFKKCVGCTMYPPSGCILHREETQDTKPEENNDTKCIQQRHQQTQTELCVSGSPLSLLSSANNGQNTRYWSDSSLSLFIACKEEAFIFDHLLFFFDSHDTSDLGTEFLNFASTLLVNLELQFFHFPSLRIPKMPQNEPLGEFGLTYSFCK